MPHCPSHDWDRYIASQEGPMPVGNARKVRSKEEHRCETCGGVILPRTFHMMQVYIGDEGFFIKPARNHLPGECLPMQPEDFENGARKMGAVCYSARSQCFGVGTESIAV